MKELNGMIDNVVYNEDCLHAMRLMPDNAFDIAIVDPPYGLSKDATDGRGKLKDRILNTGQIQRWDKVPGKDYFDELFRVSRNQIIWGGNYFGLPRTRCVIAWDKCQPWPNFSQWEMAWTSYDKPAYIFRFDNRTGGKIHPTQKPVELYEFLLSRFAEPGMRILDTHVGSGSIRIACAKFGCRFTGYEIDPEYYALQEKRYQQALNGYGDSDENQLNLFN